MIVLCACGSTATPPPDGAAPPLALDVVAPGTQIPLHYGMSTTLTVRYRTDDAAMTPQANATVHFSIFGDPAGSTLSSDVARTDASGLGSVTLTAGQAEASFRVAATAVNAPEADFDVGVSKLGFVELDAEVSWPGPPAASTVRALVYDTLSCASLPPSPTVPAQFVRASAKPGASDATFQFLALLSKDYALMGRAEDANGKLVAYGCVDIPAALAPPGSISMVPIPMAAVQPSPLGVFTLTSSLTPDPSLTAPVIAPWQTFGGCKYGAAQMLLDVIDATEKTASPSIATAMEMHRDAAGSDGCRPTSATSLDEQLQALLTSPMNAPASALPDILDDLESLVTTLDVTSQLTVTAASDTTFAGEHLLQTAELSLGPMMKTYQLSPFGLPIIDVKDVAIGFDGATLTIGPHAFTLGFAPLWGQALADLSLTVRVANLASPPVHGLVAAIVAAATRPGNKTGCAAVEDLICSAIGSPSPCSLQAACASAVDGVAQTLSAPLAAPLAPDLSWSGSAAAMDTQAMLVIDTLSGGMWTSPELMSGQFGGKRAP